MSDAMLQQHMDRATPAGRALYDRLVHLLAEIGPYTVHPAKSTITFKGVRRGFCGAHPVQDSLKGYFDLTRALPPDARVRSVSPYTRRLFVHHFRVVALDEMDDTFHAWLREAYAVGRGDHLLPAE
ncbi:MAG: DUF5655 domain-containing protein [Anaerolineae bacterium]|nr:DUF5655 domain-containing protein [Anaerolineae bacterium]